MELAHLIVSILGNTQLGVVSSILTMPILAYILKDLNAMWRQDKKRNEALMNLLEGKIIEIHSEVLDCKDDADLMSDEKIESCFGCYKSYKEMGGNGFIERMIEDVKEIRNKKLRR